MSQPSLPLSPKQAAWTGLLLMLFPFVVYFFTYWPVESVAELMEKSGQGRTGPLAGLFLMFLILCFFVGVWEFSRGIFLLLFGDWYSRKRLEQYFKRKNISQNSHLSSANHNKESTKTMFHQEQYQAKDQEEEFTKSEIAKRIKGGLITVVTPSEMSSITKVRRRVRDTLERLPAIEPDSIAAYREEMINQSGSIHPCMNQGSLEKTVDFVIRMIQETENYIRSCKGIIKVEKALVISEWPLGKPVLEIQYEQFWDNNTSNVYCEHVMRVGIDQYEVFGSKKSYERMKALWEP